MSCTSCTRDGSPSPVEPLYNEWYRRDGLLHRLGRLERQHRNVGPPDTDWKPGRPELLQRVACAIQNRGSVQASVNLKALITLQLLTGQAELFSLQRFGAIFGVPGIVTIGPNFRVFGQLGVG